MTLFSLLLLQGAEATWVGPLAAISLLVIALVAVAVAVAALVVARQGTVQAKQLGRTLRDLHTDLAPALQAVRELAGEGRSVAATVRDEVEGVVETSRRLRAQLEDGVARVNDRIHDLDELFDVVYSEVRETALDIAALIRSGRRGFGVVGGIRRILGAGRRRLKRKAR